MLPPKLVQPLKYSHEFGTTGTPPGAPKSRIEFMTTVCT
jgi:hypothetical protein